jgi:hypothetical protein
VANHSHVALTVALDVSPPDVLKSLPDATNREAAPAPGAPNRSPRPFASRRAGAGRSIGTGTRSFIAVDASTIPAPLIAISSPRAEALRSGPGVRRLLPGLALHWMNREARRARPAFRRPEEVLE